MVSYESVVSKLPEDSIKTTFTISGKNFTTCTTETEETYNIKIISDWDHLVLHWGLGVTRPKDWKCPMDVQGVKIPTNSTKFDDKSCQSKFVEIHPAFSTLELILSKSSALQINFVIKRDNSWFNNNSQNYSILLKAPENLKLSPGDSPQVQSLAEEIIRVETEYNSWTLMHRFKLCKEWLDRLGSDINGLAYIYVWMRYSALRKLTWQKNFNTRPSELAASNQTLSFTVAGLLKNSSKAGLVNHTTLLRGILSSMGKGGNNGQRIRDMILEIMHRNGIKEHDNYYEQWHQKLHNNTTPDDIGICEATIEFNKTNNLGKFYEVLGRHGITRERLRTFERPITMEPFYAPHLINDLYAYLDLLKAVHGSVDLNQSINSCRGFLPGDLQGALNDLVGSLQHWDKIGQMEKTYNVRRMLNSAQNKENVGQYRECLYLDMNLESYTRQLCEEILHLDIKFPHLCRELRVLINSVKLMADFEELEAASDDFFSFIDRFAGEVERNMESALILKASCDRLLRVLGTYVDEYSHLIGDKSVLLGTSFGVDKHFVDLFTEESIRGSLLFAVSVILKKIDRILRGFCHFQSWQIISPRPSSSGKFLRVTSLSEVAYLVYPEATILICDRVTGEEEIPENVNCVISLTELDALAHVSVRARNNKVLLAILFDQSLLDSVLQHLNHPVKVSMTSSGLSFERLARVEAEEKEVESREVKKPEELKEIIIQAEDFGEGRTGAKANNCFILKTRLPQGYGVPLSVALPYGTFEFVLEQEMNSDLRSKFEAKSQSLDARNSKDVPKILNELKEIVLAVKLPEQEQALVRHVLAGIGCPEGKWALAWNAIKKVWASKFNERVFLSTLKSKIALDQVVMSVLCQEVISGQFAYVLHTKNPFNNNPDELYGELVLGLGETLVGAYEGRALSFIVNKRTLSIQVTAFLSKSIALRGSGYIFRSDSNSEDLPGFAGAGLFDSFVMEEAKSETLRYKDERIVTDKSYRDNLISEIATLGIEVERVFDGEAQDIEGVVSNGRLFVVQSRPQV